MPPPRGRAGRWRRPGAIWAEGKGGRVKGDGGRGTGGHGFDDVDGSQVVAAHLLLEDAHVLQSFHT